MRISALFLTLLFTALGSTAFGQSYSLGQCYYLSDIGNKALYPQRQEFQIYGDKLTYKITGKHYLCAVDQHGYLRWMGTKALASSQRRTASGHYYWERQIEGQAIMGSAADTGQKVATLGNHFAQIVSFDWPISKLVEDADFTEKLSGERYLIRMKFEGRFLNQRASKKYNYPVREFTTHANPVDLMIKKTNKGWNFAD